MLTFKQMAEMLNTGGIQEQAKVHEQLKQLAEQNAQVVIWRDFETNHPDKHIDWTKQDHESLIFEYIDIDGDKCVDFTNFLCPDYWHKNGIEDDGTRTDWVEERAERILRWTVAPTPPKQLTPNT